MADVIKNKINRSYARSFKTNIEKRNPLIGLRVHRAAQKLASMSHRDTCRDGKPKHVAGTGGFGVTRHSKKGA